MHIANLFTRACGMWKLKKHHAENRNSYKNSEQQQQQSLKGRLTKSGDLEISKSFDLCADKGKESENALHCDVV